MGVIVVMSWWGRRWVMDLPCTEIYITGAEYAENGDLIKLAGVDTGMALFSIESRFVADRVQRHPWVREARVFRLPTGKLSITVEERKPVVRVLDQDGRTSWFLDRSGFPMPDVQDAVFNVPLLTSRQKTFHPIQPVNDSTLQVLLRVLADLDAETDALISEVEVRSTGETWLKTSPIGVHGAIDVCLGRDAFEDKLQKLKSFWYQAVLARKEKRIELIDLRFNSQVVTRERMLIE